MRRPRTMNLCSGLLRALRPRGTKYLRTSSPLNQETDGAGKSPTQASEYPQCACGHHGTYQDQLQRLQLQRRPARHNTLCEQGRRRADDGLSPRRRKAEVLRLTLACLHERRANRLPFLVGKNCSEKGSATVCKLWFRHALSRRFCQIIMERALGESS